MLTLIWSTKIGIPTSCWAPTPHLRLHIKRLYGSTVACTNVRSTQVVVATTPQPGCREGLAAVHALLGARGPDAAPLRPLGTADWVALSGICGGT